MDTDRSIGRRRRRAITYGKGSRRIWSTQEDEALLECLRDIVRSGWKCDDGFRTGYLGMLEQLLRKKCPESGQKSDPHISSKLHVWKRTYACITDMLARSGFGWNETIQMIVVSDEVFDSYAKIDHFAKTLRRYIQCIDNVSIETVPVLPEYYVPSPDPNAFGDDHEFMSSFTQSTAHLNVALSDTERVSSKKRKKSISTVDEKFDAKFDTFVSVTDNRLGDLAKRFGVEQDESHARRQGTMLDIGDKHAHFCKEWSIKLLGLYPFSFYLTYYVRNGDIIMTSEK
ncbi:UNVERIFIED_CONTAM: hypothetical protein Slati_4275900 [Sesamum latifolium]|uniref:Myb/SANT-like domain-containing protein n=1 Tax=Sesamum latifolium TaxID=2727402 RepID=A0AAW2TBW4_9LAMI